MTEEKEDKVNDWISGSNHSYGSFFNMVERSDSTLRHSTFDILRFAFNFLIRFLSPPDAHYLWFTPNSQHTPVHESVIPFKSMGGKIGVDFDLTESDRF